MDREMALAELDRITDGIDRDELDDPGGWWETSEGVIFGAGVLDQLRDLVRRLTVG